MIFGHEVGSTQAVVIGKSNLGLVPIWTRRTQNSGPKGECVLILMHSFALCSQCDEIFLAPRCEFLACDQLLQVNVAKLTPF